MDEILKEGEIGIIEVCFMIFILKKDKKIRQNVKNFNIRNVKRL